MAALGRAGLGISAGRHPYQPKSSRQLDLMVGLRECTQYHVRVGDVPLGSVDFPHIL